MYIEHDMPQSPHSSGVQCVYFILNLLKVAQIFLCDVFC
jgi:hypothetical protein